MLCLPRLDPKLVNGAVAQRLGERLVHEAVLLQQRQPGEAAARDRHLEVVAAAAVLDAEFRRLRKGGAEQGLELLGGHASMVRGDAYPVARWSSGCFRSESSSFRPSVCRCTSSSRGIAS